MGPRRFLFLRVGRRAERFFLMALSLSILHPLVKAEMAQKVTAAVRARRPDDAVAGTLAAQVDAAAKTVMQAAGPKHEKTLTEALVRLDRERDQAFSALCLVVHAHTLLPGDAQRRAKAARLYEQLVPGSLDFLYDSMHLESQVLEERMRHFDSPAEAALAAELGLWPFVEGVKNAMKAFQDAFQARSEKRQERPEPLYDAVIPLDRSLRALHACLIANWGPEATREVFSELERAMASARAHATRRDQAADAPQA